MDENGGNSAIFRPLPLVGLKCQFDLRAGSEIRPSYYLKRVNPSLLRYYMHMRYYMSISISMGEKS